MKLTLEIKMDSKAFVFDPATELARVLRELSVDIDSMFIEAGTRDELRDANDEVVGYFILTDEEAKG